MKFSTKYLVVFSLMLALVSHQPLYADQNKESSGWGAFIGSIIGALFGDAIEKASQKPSPNCIYINKKNVQQTAINKINNLCSTNQQFPNDREQICVLRTNIVSEINTLDTVCYTSQTQADQDCDNLTKNKAAEYISRLAYQYALEEAKSWHKQPPVNPIYVNKIDPHTFASDAAEQIALEVKNQYVKNYNGALEQFWGDALKKKIETIAQHKFQRSIPLPEPIYIDYTKIEQDVMNRIDRLCATPGQNPTKQQIVAKIKQQAREQIMYDIRHKKYPSHQEAQADAIQKLNSFLPEILQDYASSANKTYVKQRAIEALERNADNGLKYLISDELQ